MKKIFFFLLAALLIAALVIFFQKRNDFHRSESDLAPVPNSSPGSKPDGTQNIAQPSPPTEKGLSNDIQSKPATWNEWVDQTWKMIPTPEQVKQSLANAGKDYPHSAAAPVVRNAAASIGELADYIDQNKANPKVVNDGIRFFVDCAKDSQKDDTIRALCAANARNLARHVGQPDPWKNESLPSHIKELADRVPQTW